MPGPVVLYTRNIGFCFKLRTNEASNKGGSYERYTFFKLFPVMYAGCRCGECIGYDHHIDAA